MVKAVARLSRGISLGQGATCIGREGTSRTGFVGFHGQNSRGWLPLVFSTETRWGAKKTSKYNFFPIETFCSALLHPIRVHCKRFQVKKKTESRESCTPT